MADFSSDNSIEQTSLTVSALLRICRQTIENNFGNLTVEGEISNVTQHASGHTYFSLKDSKTQISCVMFKHERLANNLASEFPVTGDKVVVEALFTIYEPYGRLQLKVTKISRQGAGKLHEQFLKLKAKLREDGWFNSEHKKPIPSFPSIIGVVVSLDGAAWRDIRTTLDNRFPYAKLYVYPAPAQGEGTSTLIAEAISRANDDPCDVLLVCRGGGSLEDLWAYNELPVAQAIFDSSVPVITGVGHETDETIADYVADLRASTPTGAAVAAAPARDEMINKLSKTSEFLAKVVTRHLETANQRIDDSNINLYRTTKQFVTISKQRIMASSNELNHTITNILTETRNNFSQITDNLQDRLNTLFSSTKLLNQLSLRLSKTTKYILTSSRQLLLAKKSRLEAIGPSQVLARGYTVTTKPDGDIVQSAKQLKTGEQINVIFADGTAESSVTTIKDDQTLEALDPKLNL